MIWTSGLTLKLIGYWKRSEFLYNRHHKHFNNVRLRRAALTMISERLAAINPEVRIRHVWRKMSELRDEHKRELVKKNRDPNYYPNLLYRKLSFLEYCFENYPESNENYVDLTYLYDNYQDYDDIVAEYRRKEHEKNAINVCNPEDINFDMFAITDEL